MARDFHSASSIGLGHRCLRAYWHRYHDGLKEADVPWDAIAHYVGASQRDGRGIIWWSDPDAHIKPPSDRYAKFQPGMPITGGQRSKALGGAMHARIESWYAHEPDIEWNDLPGQIAGSGLHNLPDPDRCHTVHVENTIGTEYVETKYEPAHVFRIDGVAWIVKIDLLVSAPGEFLRLGIDAPDGWALIDHKSSRNIKKYALRPNELSGDFQANLYAFAACTDLKLSSIPARWAYYETHDYRRSAAVDVTIQLEHAATCVEAATARAKALDSMRDEKDAPQNLDACTLYGGCPYHFSAGGPCDAHWPQGLLSLRVPEKKKEPMPISAEAQAKFKAFKAGGAAATTMAGAMAPAKAKAAANAPAEQPDPEPAAEPKKKRGPKPKAAAAEPDSAPTPNAGDQVELSDDTDTIVYPGEHAPVMIKGHPKDLLKILQMFLHS